MVSKSMAAVKASVAIPRIDRKVFGPRINEMNRSPLIDSGKSLDVGLPMSDSPGMDTFDCEALLYRIDATRNMGRFYTLAVEPTLFGDASLVRIWGRIGTAGRCKIELFETRAAAMAAFSRIVRRRVGRGYLPKDGSIVAQGIVTPSGAKTAQSGFVEPGDPAQ